MNIRTKIEKIEKFISMMSVDLIDEHEIISNEMELQEINGKWKLICAEIEKCHKGSLLGIKLLDTNDIVLLTKIGIFICYFN